MAKERQFFFAAVLLFKHVHGEQQSSYRIVQKLCRVASIQVTTLYVIWHKTSRNQYTHESGAVHALHTDHHHNLTTSLSYNKSHLTFSTLWEQYIFIGVFCLFCNGNSISTSQYLSSLLIFIRIIYQNCNCLDLLETYITVHHSKLKMIDSF